jgi:hypothetical protein
MKQKEKYIPWLVLVLWALACWMFFQLAYSYHFFYKEQNQLFLLSADYIDTYQGTGWLARLVGDWLTQFYYYRYAGAPILTGVLLLMGVPLYDMGVRLGLKRSLALVLPVLAMTAEAVFQLEHSFPLSEAVRAAAFVWVLWVVVAAAKSFKNRVPAVVIAIGSIAFMCGAVWLSCMPRAGRFAAPEWQIERMLAVDNEYRFGNYDRVVELVEHEEQPPVEMKFFYNLVMAQRGLLPDQLLRFVPNELGTLHKIGPETPLYTIKNMNELYWVLGDMTFTERAAMMANVFSLGNRNVRMVKRLAECNIVSGDTLAARKYLRLLEQAVAYGDWARRAWQLPVYEQKRQLRNRQDTLAVNDNSHFIMMQLLDSNPDNLIALDYMLCTELLLKDITNFKRDYDRYCSTRPRLKKLYQEALCIWLAGTEAPQEEWQRLVTMPDVMQRFLQYNQQRGSEAFRDTYWYYFDKPTPNPSPREGS